MIDSFDTENTLGAIRPQSLYSLNHLNIHSLCALRCLMIQSSNVCMSGVADRPPFVLGLQTSKWEYNN